MAGTNYGLPNFNQNVAKQMVQVYASTLFMLPQVMNQSQPIFTYNPNNGNNNGKQTYHANIQDYKKAFQDAKIDNGWELFQHEFSDYSNIKFKAPNVSTHCIYGYGVPTITHLEYIGPKPLSDIIFDDVTHHSRVLQVSDGDGTVPSYGLEICDGFAKMQQEPVVVHRYFNVTHFTVISEPKIFNQLLDILTTPVN